MLVSGILVLESWTIKDATGTTLASERRETADYSLTVSAGVWLHYFGMTFRYEYDEARAAFVARNRCSAVEYAIQEYAAEQITELVRQGRNVITLFARATATSPAERITVAPTAKIHLLQACVDTPGVIARPPLIFLCSIVLGSILQFLWPERVLPEAFNAILGGSLVGMSVIVFVLAVRELERKFGQEYRQYTSSVRRGFSCRPPGRDGAHAMRDLLPRRRKEGRIARSNIAPSPAARAAP
jgi:hypothetical protein